MSFLKHLFPIWKRGSQDKTKANGAILAALDTELSDTEQEIMQNKLVTSLSSATGEWLDAYGKIFGVIRKDSEDDTTYRNRIINYIILQRGTIPAIKAAVQNFLQDYDSDLEIYEPYTNVFTLNQSKLNGPDKLLGRYYTVAVIDVRFSRSFPVKVLDIINDFKPAGITVFATYKSGYSRNAEVIDTNPADEISTYKIRKNMNGMNDMIRGHITLTELSNNGHSTNLFIVNQSKLNSSDVLAGSFSASNPMYNLAGYSIEDLQFTNSTQITDFHGATIPVSPDFYTKTGSLAGQYAAQIVDSGKINYLYFAMDVATYFSLNYNSYLREAEPSGIYTKNTYLSLIDNPAVICNVRAAVPTSAPTHYTLQIQNLSTGTWDDVTSGDVHYEVTGGKTNLTSMANYLSDGGLVFLRIKIDPNDAISIASPDTVDGGSFSTTSYPDTVDGGSFSTTLYTDTLDGGEFGTAYYIANPDIYYGGSFSTTSYPDTLDGGGFDTTSYDDSADGGSFDTTSAYIGYEFDLFYFELGFKKDIAVRPTIQSSVIDVSHDVVLSS